MGNINGNKDIGNWPELSYDDHTESYQTIHMWTQIVGKIKLSKMPWINHSWHVALFVTPSGLTTGTLSSGGRFFQIDLDFLKHQLLIKTSQNEERTFDMRVLSVADCYSKVLSALKAMGMDVIINPVPNELENPIRLNNDERKTYEPEAAEALLHALLRSADAFARFRAGFSGKCSPVHFYWGGFDLAVSRFSGRKAPPHPGGIPNLPDWVTREAYSHEVCSCGFWPGSDALPEASYFSYIYPEPDGYKSAVVKPGDAYYHPDLGEFILPYKAVQQAADPSQVLSDFLHSTYDAAADLARWDRQNLER